MVFSLFFGIKKSLKKKSEKIKKVCQKVLTNAKENVIVKDDLGILHPFLPFLITFGKLELIFN